MKIVILDGYTLNPGDLDWTAIHQLGDVTNYDRTLPNEIVSRINDADVVLTNKVPISKATIEASPSLKYIGVLATGYNIIDLESARSRGIIVSNVPAYGTASVAQHTFALLLELTTNVGLHSQSVIGGEWSNSKDFCYWHKPLIDLAGKNFGIIGFGQIGQAVARIAVAMGMNVLAYRRHADDKVYEGVRFVSLIDCVQQADVLSLHCSLNDDNKGFINSDLLRKMKPSCFIINVSRGPLINEADLADALNKGVIAGAGLDVLSSEPPPSANPLIKAKNCIITPHIAWATQAARQRLLNTVVENIIAFKKGKPQNNVA